jgi:uncharacterized protein YggT (Ycf19 family)
MGGGPIHLAISVFFSFLILSLFVQAILSWLPLKPDNPFVRFFTTVTAPVLLPVRRLMPTMQLGIFDIGWTIAFLVVWWGLTILSSLILNALPQGW